MYLRELKKEDAPFMLEWMHDDSVVHDLQTDFSVKTLDDCIAFIENSLGDKENLNMAISDDNDEYMGTVSLKHITKDSAEFAIAIRKCAMGKGYSKYGMDEIIRYGFMNLGLSSVYWCVSPSNIRAIKFYEKYKYNQVTTDKIVISGGYNEEQLKRYIWFQINIDDVDKIELIKTNND